MSIDQDQLDSGDKTDHDWNRRGKYHEHSPLEYLGSDHELQLVCHGEEEWIEQELILKHQIQLDCLA